MSSRENSERERQPRALVSTRANEYFVPKDGIDREVITADINRYLGNDALVWPGSYKNPETQQTTAGYFINACRNLTTAMISDLKADSERWKAERRASNVEYRASTTHQSRQYYGPTETTPNAGQEERTTLPTIYEELSIYNGRGTYSNSQDNAREHSPRRDSFNYFDSYVAPYVNTNIGTVSDGRYEETLPSRKAIERPLPTRKKHIKRHKKTLPIILNKQSFEACADSGATNNMMSTDQALALKCKIMHDETTLAFELPVSGQYVESVGKTLTTWKFPGEQDTQKMCEFFVLDKLITPIIIGRNFLRETNTLNKFKHRLKTVPVLDPITLPLVRWFGTTQERLPCYLDTTLTYSSPDTGSEVNVISLDFAKEITPFIDRTVAGQIQLANGDIQKTLGRIRAKVTFGENPEYLIEAKFEVIENLRVDVILGDDLLYEADIYTKHADLFDFSLVDADNLDLGTIAWLGIGEKMIQKAGTKISTMLKKKDDSSDLEAAKGVKNGMKSIDDSDLVEEERHKREQARIEKLRGDQQLEAKAREDRAHAEYLAQRVRFMFGSPPPTSPP